MKFIWLIPILLTITGHLTSVNGQDECPSNILPESGTIKGWIQKGKPECFPGENLFSAIDGAAEVYIEYGFVSMARASYSRKKKTLNVEVYLMKSTDAAYGIMTMMSEGAPLIPVNGSVITGKIYFGMVAKGKYFVIITEPSGKGELDNEINKLIIDLDSRINEKIVVPEIISNLHIEGITKAILFNGDIVLSNNYYLGLTRPFNYEQGVYIETGDGPVIVFKCKNDVPLINNINTTLENFDKTEKYIIDYKNNLLTNKKGVTFRIWIDDNKIIMSAMKRQ